jgi:hypothetical protein
MVLTKTSTIAHYSLFGKHYIPNGTVEHIQSWVNNKRFNHMQQVALGALVMLTNNIDLKVGAANGTIGIVTKLEFNFKNNVCSIFFALNPLGYVKIVWKKSIQNKYDSLGHF